MLEALLGPRAHRGRLVAVRQGRRTRARAAAAAPGLLCCSCGKREQTGVLLHTHIYICTEEMTRCLSIRCLQYCVNRDTIFKKACASPRTRSPDGGVLHVAVAERLLPLSVSIPLSLPLSLPLPLSIPLSFSFSLPLPLSVSFSVALPLPVSLALSFALSLALRRRALELAYVRASD